MILPVEYSWLEVYLNNDALWLDDNLNWDEVFDLALTEVNVYSILTTPLFVNQQIFISTFTKLSFIDILFLSETNKMHYAHELYSYLLWDISATLNIKLLVLQFLFYTDYQNFFTIMLYYTPELVLGVLDYVETYWTAQSVQYTVGANYDVFSDFLNTTVSEFVEYFLVFGVYCWLLVFFIDTTRLTQWTTVNDVYAVRILYYFFSLSKDLRIQFEVMLQVVFFVFFYWSMMATVFDDDREEVIENFHSMLVVLFGIVVSYVFFKYSTHYFAFLEPSSYEERSAAFITKQFARDFINTFALILRFFVLLFRLNIYDTLDDFFDSYYIFIGDFDDDEYWDELFFSINGVLFYDTDVYDDRELNHYETTDISFDGFYWYFLLWNKFFMFILGILEEVARIVLALYVCYLITFDVHAVNNSYTEDRYIQTCRNRAH